jgi:hypothetical protein
MNLTKPGCGCNVARMLSVSLVILFTGSIAAISTIFSTAFGYTSSNITTPPINHTQTTTAFDDYGLKAIPILIELMKSR